MWDSCFAAFAPCASCLCLLLFVSLILLPSVCFASFDATFRQSPSGLLVNLSGTNYWRHSDNAVWLEGESGTIPNPNYYYDNQIVCSVELQRNNLLGGSHDLELSLELLSSEWCYILTGNDSKHKRPFGLQIMARGQLDNGSYATIGQGVSVGGTTVATAGNLVILAGEVSRTERQRFQRAEIIRRHRHKNRFCSARSGTPRRMRAEN